MAEKIGRYDRDADPKLTPPIGIVAESICRIKIGKKYLLVLDQEALAEDRFVLKPVGGRCSLLDDPLHWLDDLSFKPAEGKVESIGTIPSRTIFRFAQDRARAGERKDSPNEHISQLLQPFKLLTPSERKISWNYAGTHVIKSPAKHASSAPPEFNVVNIFDVRLQDHAKNMLVKAQDRGLGMVLVDEDQMNSGAPIKLNFQGRVVEASFSSFCDIVTRDSLPSAPFALIGDIDRGRLIRRVMKLTGADTTNVLPIPEYKIADFRKTLTYKIEEFLSFVFEGIGPGKRHRVDREDIKNMRGIDSRIIDLLEFAIVTRRGSNYLYRVVETIFEVCLMGSAANPATEFGNVLFAGGLSGTIFMDGVTAGAGKGAKDDVSKYLLEAFSYFVRTHADETWLRGLSDYKTEVERIASALADAEPLFPPLVEVLPSVLAVGGVLLTVEDKRLLLAAVSYFVLTQLLYIGVLKSEGFRIPKYITHFAASLSKFWPAIRAIPSGNIAPVIISALTLLTAHSARVLDGIEEHEGGVKNRASMQKIFDKFQFTLGSEKLWQEHALNILLEENLVERMEQGRRRFIKLDEMQQALPQTDKNKPFLIFENYDIGLDGKYIVKDGNMVLTAGTINLLEIPSKENRIICTAQLGDFFHHDRGTALVRDVYNDLNAHEKGEVRVVNHFKCDYDKFFYDAFSNIANEDLIEYFHNNDIAINDLQFDATDHYFKRKGKLIARYLYHTGMFNDGEIDASRLGNNIHEVVSPTYARRVKIAAAMLSRSRVLVLRGVYDLDGVQDSQQQEELLMLDRITIFLAREAKKGEKIILLGTDGKSVRYRDIFREENALGKVYTIEDKRFVEVD